MHVNLYAVADCAGLHYGSGLYTEAGALVNHACAPTCAVSFRGRTWRLHALRDIARGEEVCCSHTYSPDPNTRVGAILTLTLTPTLLLA